MSVSGAPTTLLNPKQKRQAQIAANFAAAVRHHQAGELAQAEGLYRKALAANPKDISSLYNLGLVMFQSRRLEDAAKLFRKATLFKPDHADAHGNLGGALRELGRLEDAVASLTRALALRPQDALSHTTLGLVLRDLGRLDEAKAHLAAALALDPTSIQAQYHHANILLGQGAHQLAFEGLAKLAREQPDLTDVWIDLGVAHRGLGRTREAMDCYKQALDRDPSHCVALFNIGSLIQAEGRLDEAATLYRRALALKPDFIEARLNLSLLMIRLGRLDEALAGYQAVLATSPNQADALCGLGNTLERLGRLDEAVEAFQRGLEARPDASATLTALGGLLQQRGRLTEAIQYFSENVRYHPDQLTGWGLLASAKKYAADWTDLELCENTALSNVETSVDGPGPFGLLMLNSGPEQQLAAARGWAARLAGGPAFTPRAPHRRDRIRVGYVSADFRNHATAYLATGVFEHHDRARFEVFAYCISADDRSAERARLKTAFDRFVDLNPLSHEQAARAIHADEIDILVDLKGYTGGARSEIFTYRPAPIQVSYLGYPGPMGAPFIDYTLADPFVAPASMAAFYDERLAHLPISYQPNMRRPIAAEAGTRADHGLPADAFVFCCFNQPYKITPMVFDVWMRLLRAEPGSVLWLIQWNATAADNLRREAVSRGVDPARLILSPVAPSPQHLARHRHADLFLDTLPVCAHTTASDALWAGLPLISCVGETFISRVSGSLLTAMGLPDLVVETLADYEALALRLAREPAALAAIRGRLWDARTTSTLFDAAVATRHIEAAYEIMWDRHRRGLAPEAFAVGA